MKQEVLVIGTNAYKSTFNGQEFKGVRVAYLINEKDINPDISGHFPAEVKFDYEMKSKIKDVPGIYELEMQMVQKKGKTELAVTGIDFIAPYNLTW